MATPHLSSEHQQLKQLRDIPGPISSNCPCLTVPFHSPHEIQCIFSEDGVTQSLIIVASVWYSNAVYNIDYITSRERKVI